MYDKYSAFYCFVLFVRKQLLKEQQRAPMEETGHDSEAEKKSKINAEVQQYAAKIDEECVKVVDGILLASGRPAVHLLPQGVQRRPATTSLGTNAALSGGAAALNEDPVPP